MSNVLYVRWKSQLSGPFPVEEIGEMLADGRITKHHQVSDDRANWTPVMEWNDYRHLCKPQIVSKKDNIEPRQQQQVVSTIRLTANHQSSTTENKVHLVSPLPAVEATRWFYAENNEATGPVSESELQRLVQSGQLASQIPVCKEGDELWRSYEDVFPSYNKSLPIRIPVRKEPDQDFKNDYSFAGFWRRCAAGLIDLNFSSICSFVVLLCLVFVFANTGLIDIQNDLIVIAWLNFFISFMIGWLYFACLESSSRQATFGKRAMNLVVVDLNGQRISFGHATGRYFGKIISSLILWIGYFIIPFTDKKQALHDLIANTLVLRRHIHKTFL